MPLETDLNIEPFWDDFDENKNYHRVLFRPRTSVQVRELNQLQTILQNQIERFGQNIFNDGTIIKGCAFTYDNRACYIKLNDAQVDGQPVNVEAYVGTILKNSSNVVATVVDAVTGFESQNPDLKTLYVKYTGAGANNERFFAPNDVLTAYSNTFGIQKVEIANSGLGYSNGDLLGFTDTTGTSAQAIVTTDNNGAITNIAVTNSGTNYSANAVAVFANTSGNGAILLPNTNIAQITVASNTFYTANDISYSTVGVGYRFKVGDGIIFQKGFFTRVEPQSVVVSKYNNNPNGVVVGFSTLESFANGNLDESLYDNSTGEPNFSAPGAFRLKLEPKLLVKSSEDATDSNTFFTVVEFDNGAPIRTNKTTQFNTVAAEMARRTSEESGDYVVNPFTVYTDEIESNTTHIQARISSGLAYINGYRVEQFNTSSVPLRQGTDTKTLKDVTLSTNYSNYVLVQNLEGFAPFNTIATISLRDTISSGAGSAAAGNEIGTAQVRNIAIDSGNTYRVYLFNIRMTSGKTFADVKSVYYNGGGSPQNFAADVVLSSGAAVLQEPSFSSMIFDTGRKALKTFKDEDNNNNTSYTYTNVDSIVSFTSNGIFQKNLTGDDKFPYNGTLNNTEELDFIFVARNTVNAAANGTGTVAYTANSTTVTGTSTLFLNEYTVGDYIVFGSGVTKQIISIANNTSLTAESVFAAANTSTTHRRTYPVNKPIPFTNRPGRSISVTGNQTLTANLGETLSGVLNITAVYNVLRSPTLPLFKNFSSNSAVKLNLATAANTTGPWCLGIPDVTTLVSVTRTSNADYITDAADVTSEFEIDNGQLETHYGLAWLKRKPSSSISLSSSDRLVVKVNHFTSTSTGGGIGFYTIDSYPIDDASSANTATTIKTQDVPIVVTPNRSYDLRNCVDFRPVCSNTATITTSVGSATVNPSSVETFSSAEKNIPAVNKQFQTDLQYYVGRYDIVTINSLGQRSVVEGVVSETPYPPKDVEGAMTIATVSIPPYPTLPTKIGYKLKRPDYTTLVTINQPRRYTMQDLNKFEDRIQRLEYYTALSLLDKQTNDMSIPSSVEAGVDRFKNGIFVDSFANFNASNVTDGEFKASIDPNIGQLAPMFEQSSFDLKATEISGLTTTGDLITLPYTSNLLMQQPYASVARNCTQNFWNFKGKVFITPSYDNFYDIRHNPQSTTINVDAGASSTLALVNELNKVRALNGTSTSTSTSSTVVAQDPYSITYQDTVTTTTSSSVMSVSTNTSTVAVGDFVTDISMNPFVREQPIHFRAYGLKPNAKVWVYFDKVEVTPLCQLCTYDGTTAEAGNDKSAWHPKSVVGGGLVTDSTGAVAGIFYVPRGTFFTGDREFKILDINSILFEDAATSSASTTFHAYNYSVTKTGIVVSTRTPVIDATTSSSTSTTSTLVTKSTGYTGDTSYVEPPQPTPPPIPVFDGEFKIDRTNTPYTEGNWRPTQTPLYEGDIGLIGGYDINIYNWLIATGGVSRYNAYVNNYYPNRAANCLVADPIAQTFTIQPETCAGEEGLFLTKVDVYFKQKDPNLGVTLNLRLTENGYPSKTVIPLSEKHLTSAQVNVSENASAVTTFHFDSPVFLKAGYEYALVVQPDGNSPEYLIWASKTGETDVLNPAITVRLDWGDGVMFTSTNNSAWNSVQDEDLKFTLYYANFTSGSGSVTLTNGKDEFFSTTHPNGYTFYHGEKVFKYGGAINGNVSFSNTSSTVTGRGTNFLTQFTPNSYIVLSNAVSLPASANDAATTTVFEVFQINTIANNTSMTLRGVPNRSANGTVALSTPIATVKLHDADDDRIHLIDSTANTSSKFAVGDAIMGSLSNSWFDIDSLDDLQISYFQPLIYRSTVTSTGISGSASFTNDAYVSQPARDFKFNDSNFITDFKAVVSSYSTELDHSSNKSAKLVLTFNSTSPLVSPVLDMQSCSLLRYKYLINNDNSNENTSYGSLKSKYVSLNIPLNDELDSEDLLVYLNGYRPSTTDIDVYARFLNASDPDIISDKSWTKLTNRNDALYSSSASRNDFREFSYSVPNLPPVTYLSGVVTVTGNTTSVSGANTLFSSQLAVGDTVTILVDNNTYHVSQVAAIASNTSLTLSEGPPIAYSSAIIAKFDDSESVFRDPKSLGSLSYYSGGAKYNTFKAYALKVGLRSSTGQQVPRLQDIRAVAASV